MFLARPEIAQVVVNAMQDGEVRFHRYKLHSFVIMPNHVHLLVTPQIDARRWLGPLKGFTAHEANRILERNGEPFWQDESYDHAVRTDAEFNRICAYIETNPVKAGLAETPESFRWSSAYKEPPGKAAAAKNGWPHGCLSTSRMQQEFLIAFGSQNGAFDNRCAKPGGLHRRRNFFACCGVSGWIAHNPAFADQLAPNFELRFHENDPIASGT